MKLITIGQLVSEIFMLESVDAPMHTHTHGQTDGPRLESHTIKGARVVTTLFIGFSYAQGQLTPKSVMESCLNSIPLKF